MESQDNKPNYEIIEHEGQPARLYPDGSIRDDRGYFLAPHPKSQPFDSNSGQEAGRKRWLRLQEAASRGVERAIREAKPANRYIGSSEAWEEIVYHLVRRIMDQLQEEGGNLRSVTEALRFASEAAGYMPGRSANTINATQQNVNLYGGDQEVIELILSRARKMVDGRQGRAE